jgi:hypothetical protein
MKRGAAMVYPKDAAQIVASADVFPRRAGARDHAEAADHQYQRRAVLYRTSRAKKGERIVYIRTLVSGKTGTNSDDWARIFAKMAIKQRKRGTWSAASRPGKMRPSMRRNVWRSLS